MAWSQVTSHNVYTKDSVEGTWYSNTEHWTFPNSAVCFFYMQVMLEQYRSETFSGLTDESINRKKYLIQKYFI